MFFWNDMHAHAQHCERFFSLQLAMAVQTCTASASFSTEGSRRLPSYDVCGTHIDNAEYYVVTVTAMSTSQSSIQLQCLLDFSMTWTNMTVHLLFFYIFDGFGYDTELVPFPWWPNKGFQWARLKQTCAWPHKTGCSNQCLSVCMCAAVQLVFRCQWPAGGLHSEEARQSEYSHPLSLLTKSTVRC